MMPVMNAATLSSSAPALNLRDDTPYYYGVPFNSDYYEGPGTRRDGYDEYGAWMVRHSFATAWADDIEAQYGLVSGDDVLVVGCAYGFLVDELASRGANVIGIDISSYAIGEANSRFPTRTFVEEDFLSNSFSNNQFHLTVCIGSLECMSTEDQMQTFLNQVNRVTRPTGVYYFLIDYDNYAPYYQNKTATEWLAAFQAGLPGPYTFDVQDIRDLSIFYTTRVVVT
jgi:SAM-dependent methyltransferase